MYLRKFYKQIYNNCILGDRDFLCDVSFNILFPSLERSLDPHLVHIISLADIAAHFSHTEHIGDNFFQTSSGT